ncbi:hypothetical protein PENNAL_c0088G00283 [Penicillium nalgiovense]|uniref:Uncharacterized protein n=1 Tax=Penicillium nalgiovense TaxID=60175 RepID=A0A1V6XDY7_PENNA|nr:hypothetical protein PENNAL_c0088G00283 [Penicillium nalgiovense]
MKNPSKTSRGPQCHLRRWSSLKLLNEAATRCIIKAILFVILDKVAPCPDPGTWPLNSQNETQLLSRPITVREVPF